VKLRNVGLIARRDYLAYVARRRFWIGLFFTPAILLAIIFVPGLIHKFESAHKFAVVDQSGWVLKATSQRIRANDYDTLLTIAAANAATRERAALPPLLARVATPAAQLDVASRAAVSKALAEGGPVPASGAALSIWQQRAAFAHWYQGLSSKEARALNPGLAVARYQHVSTDAGPDALRSRVTQGDLFAYFVIPPDPLTADARFVYASRNLTDTGLLDWYKEQITAVIQARKVATVGLPADKAQWLKTPVDFHSQLVTKAGAKTATAAEKAAQWMPVGYVYLLFIAIMSIAQLLMMSTIEEKSNRIAETLLSTVDPGDVMAGKTFGAAAVGITMMCFWLALILGLLGAFGSSLPIGGFAHALLASISVSSIVWFLVYFILGFLLYASVLGAIGAAVNNIQEAQPYIAPVTMFMILPMILMVPVVKDPTATWTRVLSYFPPLTPFLMVNRAAAPPPLIDYIATTALLVVTVAVVLYGSGRIFRIGLLNTGAPPKVRELLAWMRTPAPDKSDT